MPTDQALQQLKAAFTQLHPGLTAAEWAYISGTCTQHSLASKAYLIQEGDLQQAIFFLLSGLVRGYYINARGEEITIRFINNTGWVTHYAALLTRQPSRYFFQALEQSSYLVIPYEAILKGYDQYKGLERFGRLIAESILKSQQQRIESFQFLNAEQRYLEFSKPACPKTGVLRRRAFFCGISATLFSQQRFNHPVPVGF